MGMGDKNAQYLQLSCDALTYQQMYICSAQNTASEYETGEYKTAVNDTSLDAVGKQLVMIVMKH